MAHAFQPEDVRSCSRSAAFERLKDPASNNEMMQTAEPLDDENAVPGSAGKHPILIAWERASYRGGNRGRHRGSCYQRPSKPLRVQPFQGRVVETALGGFSPLASSRCS